MIDLRFIEYRVVAITPEGQQLDITASTTDLGWEEGEKEYAARISLKLYDAMYEGKRLSELVQPLTPVFVYAICNGESTEVIRGTIEEWSPTDSNGKLSLDITAYDEMKAMRQSQDDQYFTDGLTTKQIITTILDAWNVPYDYQGPENITHSKFVFRKNYISDMCQKVLADVKKQKGGVYFMRAKEGKVQIIPRGSNETTYHLDAYTNIIQTKDKFSTSGMVTRVKIVGKTKDEGRPPVEATIDRHTEYGVRQVILEHADKKTLEEVQKEANQILDEKSLIKRTTDLQGPDVPFLRKGDRIRIKSGSLSGYWFVKSIRHNAADGKMSLKIDEDKEKNKEEAEKQQQEGGTSVEYDTGENDEYGGDE